ncbi:MAG: hypothetical protein GQ540_11100, partial [Lutibacter sp.]|uniref:beta strand repeat-containing protein n=1 Tax=Lutibacter sp. TaxID=1925666 RepID=UPI001A046A95
CTIASYALNVTSFTCANLGANTVTLSVTDEKGNVGSNTATVTVADAINPTAITQDITVNLDGTGNLTIAAADVNNLSTDNCGISSLSVSPNTFTCANFGDNVVTFTVTDASGNSASTTATVTVEDTVVPVVNTQNITVQLDGTGNVTITPVQIENGSTDACGIANYSLDIDEFTCEDAGENTVTLTVTDVNGNSNSATATVTVQDVTAPVVVTKDITVQLNAAGSVSFVGTDVNNGSTDICGIASYSVSPSTLSCANVGANTVTLTVTDVNGNSNSATAIVTVQDNVAPTVITQNVTVQLDASGNGSTTATAVNNGSSDACGVASLSVSPSAFTCANIGVNTVALTVTDNNGNSNTETATVTVEDNVVPVVITQNITVQLDGTGNVTITPAQIDNVSTDSCGIAGYSLNSTSFDCKDIGLNTVTLTVTDVNGNSNSAPATVTVQDTVVPVVNTQNIVVQLDVTGNVTITPAQIDNVSTDNCGIAGYSLNTTSFDCKDVGGNTVALTVTDVNGNSNTATATVTVEDTVVPVVNTQNIIVQLDGTGNVTITPVQIENGSTDNCGIAGYSLDIDEFTCEDAGENTVTLTVTDVNGNSNSATAIVTVEDNVAPVVNTQNITVQLDVNGEVTVTPVQIDNVSTDNCEIDSYEIAKSSGSVSSTLYFTGTYNGTVWSANRDGSGSPTVLYDTSDGIDTAGPVGVEVNLNSGILYYAGGNTNDIFSASADGTGTISTVSNTNLGYEHHDFEFDWDNNRIFYTGDEEGLFVANADGTGSAANIIDDASVIALTYNSTTDKIYYVTHGDWNIGVINADGTSQNNNLIDANSPRGITIDEASGRLFWVEKNLGKVYTALADGSETPYELYDDGADGIPYGIDYDASTGMIYWTLFSISEGDYGDGDTNIDYVFKAPADGSGSPELVYSGEFGGIRGIAAGRNLTGVGSGIFEESVAYTCEDIGENEVTLKVTDIYGNSSTATAVVTVEDTVAPNVVTVAPFTLQLDAEGSTLSIDVEDIENGSTDACGIESYALDVDSFDCSNVGENTVTLSVTDIHGNTGTATTVVTIEDNVAPVVITQNVTVALNSRGEAFI